MDSRFRAIGPLLRKGVDAQEDYSYSLLHFREVCSFGWQMDILECVKKMCDRAEESSVSLSLSTVGEVSECGRVRSGCGLWVVGTVIVVWIGMWRD